MNSEEMKLFTRIQILKGNLHRTDYKAIKFSEGELSASEYAPVLAQRRAWRAEINLLESKLSAYK